MDKYKKDIIDFCGIAQSLINELHKCDPDNDTFEQAGLLNGEEIIHDYINHGELGVALEHLLYMVYESDISFSLEDKKTLNLIAKECGIKNNYSK